MNYSSNGTRYFNLPLFAAEDKPSWLVDWNNTMNELDTILNRIATTTATSESIELLNSELSKTNGNVATLQTAVSNQGTEIASNEARLESLEDGASGQAEKIMSLESSTESNKTAIDNANTEIENANTEIQSLDDRVTANEDAITLLNSLKNASIVPLNDNPQNIPFEKDGKKLYGIFFMAAIPSLQLYISSFCNVKNIKFDGTLQMLPCDICSKPETENNKILKLNGLRTLDFTTNSADNTISVNRCFVYAYKLDLNSNTVYLDESMSGDVRNCLALYG